MSAEVTEHKPIDKFIPWMIVAFFVVLISVDMIFVTIAVKTNTGIVSETAYEDGIHYNKALDAAARQNKLGWSETFDFDHGILKVTLKDAGGKDITDAEMRAVFTRPVSAGHDFDVSLKNGSNGQYEARPDIPMPGQWNVRIYAQWQNQPYQFSRMIIVP